MENPKNVLIGITCPDCIKTTIRCYQSFPKELFHLSKITGNMTQYVPFSLKILSDYSVIENQGFEVSNTKDGMNYTIQPELVPLTNYPENILSQIPFPIADGDVVNLLRIENESGLKVFPRIIHSFSPYIDFDRLISFFTPDGIVNCDHWLEISQLISESVRYRPNLIKDNPTQSEIMGAKYAHMRQDSLTDEVFLSLDLDSLIDADKIKTHIINLVKDYAVIRNSTDFEIVFRDEIINKYAHAIYYKEGYHSPDFTGYGEAMEMIENLDDPESENHLNNSESSSIVAQKNERKGQKNESEQSSKKTASIAKLIDEGTPDLKNHENVFYRDGDSWFVKYRGKRTTIKNTKKYSYLIHLLERPKEHLGYLDLSVLVNPSKAKDFEALKEAAKTDENLTKENKMKLKETLLNLVTGYNQAKMGNDLDQQESMKAQINEITRVIRNTYEAKIEIDFEKELVKIQGREDVLNKNMKSAKKNIKGNLKNAIDSIEKKLPGLAAHLKTCIDYRPKNVASRITYDPQRSKIDKSISWFIKW